MLLRVRLSLPDRPGSLSAVTRSLGTAGADILQVTVLERAVGRAVDEFTIEVPTAAVEERVTAELDAAPGVRVEGSWRTSEQPGAFPDLGVLEHVVSNPARGLATLVEAAPGLFSADWAAVVDVAESRVGLASWQTPTPLVLPELTPLRPRTLTAEDGTRYASAPLEGRDATVLVGRRDAPPFHEVELLRLTLLVEIVCAIIGKDTIRTV